MSWPSGKEITVITCDGVKTVYVQSRANQACVQSSTPVITDDSSSSSSGLVTPVSSDVCYVSKLLTLCNPVTVSQDVVSRIKFMISTCWPSVTDEAIKAIPKFADIYQKVIAYNLPNCLGAKVPVRSALRIKKWVMLLQQYHDNELCHFLAYGWPIGYYASTPPESVLKNHPSAVEYPDHVNHFISTEKVSKHLKVQ